MALYDSLFTMMDMQAAQLLVTASDFEHDGAQPPESPRSRCFRTAHPRAQLCFAADASHLLTCISHTAQLLREYTSS